MIGKTKFRRPVGGVEIFTAASLHFHHTPAKKPPLARSFMAEIRSICEDNEVQIIGADLNQTCYGGAAEMIFPEYLYTEPPSRALWGLNGLPFASRDCVGFLLMPMLLQEGWIIRNVGTWNFDRIELFWLREHDKSTHWPCFIHLQQYLTSRADRRSADAIARRRWRGIQKQHHYFYQK